MLHDAARHQWLVLDLSKRDSYLVHGLHDPIDVGIAPDGLVLWIYENDLEVLVGRILVDPVGIKNAEVGTAASNALLRCSLERSLVL